MSSSTSRPKVNLRSTAVKRIMQEAQELATPDEDDGFIASPLEDDIFEWHCTMRGVPNSEYDGGLYHLRILLPPSYPMSAPDIILMTPNGRFELGKKICIDGLTSFHSGSWQPAWGVRTAILGLRSFWMQAGEALSAIGALDYSKDERKRLAKLSGDWSCPVCRVKNKDLLSDRVTTTSIETLTSGDKGKEEYAGKIKEQENTDSAQTRMRESREDTQQEGQERKAQETNIEESPPTLAAPAPVESIVASAPIAVPITNSQSGRVAAGSSFSQFTQPAPTLQMSNPSQPRRPRPPMWLDGLILVFAILLGFMIVHRIA